MTTSFFRPIGQGIESLARERGDFFAWRAFQRAEFLCHHNRAAHERHDAAANASHRVGVVGECHPEPADFQRACWRAARRFCPTGCSVRIFSASTAFLAQQPLNLVREGSSPVLWQRLFWYFAQAEVYVAILPCFGIITHLVATFSRKPVWKERLVVLAICGVGVIGFCVWGYHMFATGMNPYAPLVFSVLASSLGVPAAFLLASWLGTLWDARIQFTTAMLFAIGFISLFIAGGLSGIFLARHDLSQAAVSQDFVIGHFHLVMGVAATFAILAGTVLLVPEAVRLPDERDPG